MSAPLLWIGLPLFAGAILLLFRRREALILGISSGICFLLALVAWLAPLGTPIRLGPFHLQISPVLWVLGRRFILDVGDREFLTLIYTFSGIWFLGSRQAQAPAYFPPIGLGLVAMLVAAQAVEPFLYSALILEMAVLISLPLLSPPGVRPGSGTLRYLIFQTLAVPFILLAGWAAGLVEANLPGTRWVVQAVLFLGLGFSFWLAVFPFYTWMPLLAQEVRPYIYGFLLSLLPVGVLWIALGFLDTYSWLRSSPLVADGLRVTGGIMVVTAGIWAAFQTDLSRILGYAILMENGYSLLAISLSNSLGLELFAASLIPRLAAVALWTLAVEIFQKSGLRTTLDGLAGVIRRYPMVSSGLALAYFSLGGLPLLASFPVRQPLIEALAGQSLSVAIAALVGNLGFLLGGFRLLWVMVRSDEDRWHIHEGLVDTLMLLGAMILLVLAGVLPWLVLHGTLGLVQVFTHLR